MLPIRPARSCRGTPEQSGSKWPSGSARALVRCTSPNPKSQGGFVDMAQPMCAYEETKVEGFSRRGVLLTGSAGLILGHASNSEAALVRFPAIELNNTYVLVRAGECEADVAGIGYSNPVNKQSRFAELTSRGKQQVLKRLTPSLTPVCENASAWLWAATCSSSYQTAEILAATLGLGRSRLVPEYSFLDPRGLGALDCKPVSEVIPILQQGDASSALWKPPRGFDGTPNESVQDVLVRARQALSVMETQYNEELVVIIAPDSTVLSVLQAALLGIDLRDHWQLSFRPAEMRLVDLSNAAIRDDSPMQVYAIGPDFDNQQLLIMECVTAYSVAVAL